MDKIKFSKTDSRRTVMALAVVAMFVATLGVGSTDIFIEQQPYPSWSVGVGTAEWYPPTNPGFPPALTTAEQNARKTYVWNESNYQSNPSTAWVLTSL